MTIQAVFLGFSAYLFLGGCYHRADAPVASERLPALAPEPVVLPCQSGAYRWPQSTLPKPERLAEAIAPPEGYERCQLKPGSFGEWLRCLPLLPNTATVKLHSGEDKWSQSYHERVIDMDIGKRDLQQCADAVMRLRAEYLFGTGQFDRIGFHFTNGDWAAYSPWRKGQRISIANNRLKWSATSVADTSWAAFRKYMDVVFTYAGTYSLNKELQPVTEIEQLEAGDVFIVGGFPGHAMLVVDVAQHLQNGDRCFLLAQSYMPAQSIHIVKNPTSVTGPWFSVKAIQQLNYLDTHEWDFEPDHLKRFPPAN